MNRIPFHIVTFGCQMNVNDSLWLVTMLEKNGFVQAPPEQARVILINTCAVREKPEQKVRLAIRKAGAATGENPEVLVGVLGCVAQNMGKKLYENEPQVRLLAGGDGLINVPAAIRQLLENPDLHMEFLEFSPDFAERDAPANFAAKSAYVNIMSGCDNFCAYCIVPFTRGRQKSRTADAVLTECSQLLKKGAREITLLGQNVNAWGRDRHGSREETFASLLTRTGALPGLERLRFVAAHPKDMDTRTIELFGQLENLCPRLHLPLQAGSNRILKAMRRGHDRDYYLRLVEALHNARADIALSTDLITGFPGETRDDFEQTLDLMRQCQFVSSYSFCYSDRPGTRASLMPDKIAEDEKLERLAILQALQDELTAKWLQSRRGSRAKILLEKPSPRDSAGPNSWQGRDIYGASVNVSLPSENIANLQPEIAGSVVDVIITEAMRHSLRGRIAM